MGGNGLIINIVRHYLVLQFKFLLNSTEMSHQTHGRLQSFLSHKCMGVMFSILTWIIYWFSEKMVLLYPKSSCGLLTVPLPRQSFKRSVCSSICGPTMYLPKKIGAVECRRVLLEFVFCVVKLSCGGGERANTQLLYLSCIDMFFFSLLSLML